MEMQRMDSAVSDAFENLDERATTSLLNRNPITALQVRVSFLVLWRKVPKFHEMNLCISQERQSSMAKRQKCIIFACLVGFSLCLLSLTGYVIYNEFSRNLILPDRNGNPEMEGMKANFLKLLSKSIQKTKMLLTILTKFQDQIPNTPTYPRSYPTSA